jgi:putative ABC transport system permease protein
VKGRDLIRFSFISIERSPARTALMLLAMAIAVTSVILLTGLGEAARRYVVNEFATLGTNLVFVLPGKSETAGGTLGASMGGTTRPITINDAMALRNHTAVTAVAPMVVGAASINRSGLERETMVMGATSEMLSVRQWRMASGQFLPAADWQRSSAVCVIGSNIASELFAGESSAVGRWLRIGESRFRVIGVLSTTGTSFGTNVEETVIVPLRSAMTLFNTDNIFRVMVESKSPEAMKNVTAFVKETFIARHHGEEDVTVITQDAMLSTFNSVFNALTFTVTGIAAISLGVAGVLIMNVMLVSVSQRTSEVGLLKAVGAAPAQIVTLFLAEAALLSVIGAIAGVAVGLSACWLITWLYPKLQLIPPLWAVAAGVGVAFVTGILFGILPARRAAALDPIAALARR